MPITITGGDAGDPGPCGCVMRFLAASAAGDTPAAIAEVHPDCREHLSGGAQAPPGVAAAEVLAAEPGPERTLVPTRLIGADGTEQRFVFVVRPHADGIGIDLPASLAATFGGDPAAMVEQALRAAVEPLAEGFARMGEALGDAMGGSSGGGDGAPAARRIAPDETLPGSAAPLQQELSAQVLDLGLYRRLQRDDAGSDWCRSAEMTLRIAFDLDPAWTALSTLGITVSSAISCEGADLRPEGASEDFAAERYSSWERERRDTYAKLSLPLPDGPCSGLRELAGTVRMELVGGELLEIALGPVGDLVGGRVPIPALGLELDLSREPDGQLAVRVAAGGFERFEDIVPVDAAGNALDQSWSGGGDGETDHRTYSSEIPDDGGLHLRFWSRRERVEVPFQVVGLPLSIG